MDELIQDLLEYSRLPYEELNPVSTDLSRAVAEALEVVEPDLVARKAKVDVEIPFLHQAVAEGALLRRVLVNLLSNAVKFVPAGETPHLRIRSAFRDGRVRLWIEDNGIGIPREHQERIFGVFQRLNHAEDYPGTGIGLAIARRALERMGGRAGVESEPGKGSRFWIDLPAADSRTS
jgi:signal transduction histidine kinase